jgi:hypothetical protein
MGKRSQVKERMDTWAQESLDAMNADQLTQRKRQFQQEASSLTAALTAQTNTYNVSGKLQQIGTLQREIRSLEKQNETAKGDVETAEARDELLRSRETAANAHTLYIADRPVRRANVPYLWVLSVLFVGVGVLCFYWMAPFLLPSVAATGFVSEAGTGGVLNAVTEFMMSRTTWMTLFGAALVVILFLSLKIAGIFGK